MFWLKVILYSMLLALAGCGGDSAPNNDNSGGSTEVTPPTIPPSSKSIRAADFSKKIEVNSNVEQVNVNLSIFVSSLSSENITLEAVEPASKSALCQVLDVNETMLQFSISPNNASGCIYKYTVSDGSELASGYANIVVSAPSSSLQSRTKAMTSSELPPLEHNMVLGESLSINLVDDAIVDTSGMTHPLFSESVITYGNGNAVLQEDGQFDYKAISTGSTFISYYILDDMNTFSPNDDIVYQGNMTIIVSGSDNAPPTTIKAKEPIVIGAGESAEVDILAFPTSSGDISLVNDVDGDELQLVFVNAENIEAYIEPGNLNDVKNTKLTIKGLSKGSYLVDYVIYDHNKDGAAHGQIPVNVTDTLAGKITYSQEGYVKLFKDGTLGSNPISSRELSQNIESINLDMKSKGIIAQSVHSIGMALLWVKTNDASISYIVGNRGFDVFKNIKVIYGGSFYSNRIDASNIVYILFEDNHVESYSQIYYMSSTVAEETPKAFNNIPLRERSNIRSIQYFSYSLLRINYNTGESRLLSLAYNWGNHKVDIDWFDATSEPEKYKFYQCMLSHNPSQYIIESGTVNIVTLNQDQSSCLYFDSVYSKTPLSFFQFIVNINKTDPIVDIKHLFLSRSPAAFLTQSGFLYVAANSLNSWKKVSEQVIDYSINASSVVYRLENDDIGIYVTTRCVGGMHTTPPNEASSTNCDKTNGKADISPFIKALPKGYNKNVKFYILSSDVIALIYNNGELAFISARGYKKYLGNYSWLISDRIVSSDGSNFNKGPWYQGSNLFAAYNKTMKEWELFKPLEGWNGEFECSFDTSLLNLEGVIDIQLFSPRLLAKTKVCPVYIFKNNGTQLNKLLNSVAYPLDRFEDSIYLSPLIDIDNDGISNKLELNLCKSSRTSEDMSHAYYWCSFASLADSDFDDVADSFENKYSSADHFRYLSDSSHLMFEPLSLAPKDAYKDINGNGLADWLEDY